MSTHNIESPWRGDSNEHPQHRFLGRNKQNYHLIIIKYHQICTLFLLLPTVMRFSTNQAVTNFITGFSVGQVNLEAQS